MLNEIVFVKKLPRKPLVFYIVAAIALALSPHRINAGDSQNILDVVAVVDGKPISGAELKARLGEKLLRLETEEFDMRSAALNDAIDQQLMASAASHRGLSVGEFVKTEITSTIVPVTEDEARLLVENSPATYQRLPPDRALRLAVEDITARRTLKRKQEVIASLRKEAKIETFLYPPRFTNLPTGGQRAGPDSAPVSIMEFTDFQCPYCAALNVPLNRVLKEFGAQITITSKQFPLAMHPQANQAAEAALCASEQGRYWEMHDALFSEQALLAQQKFGEIAQRAGLEQKTFDSCLAANRHAADILRDRKDGMALGITSTPTLFVNGRMVVGAKPYEDIRALVMSELRAASPGR